MDWASSSVFTRPLLTSKELLIENPLVDTHYELIHLSRADIWFNSDFPKRQETTRKEEKKESCFFETKKKQPRRFKQRKFPYIYYV